MVVLFKVLQVILALSILVIVHEFGHYIFARIFKVKVDKFYLFMDIGGIRLFSTRNNPFIKKYLPRLANYETDFGIGWLPIGGYCKIAGMVDESMDTEQLKGAPQPWEFRSKKAWQRLLIMVGGVLFNFILAIFLYICILAHWGSAYISNENTDIYVNELSYDMGFRNGDHILLIDDYVPENFGMIQADLARNNAGKVTVLRDGDTLDIYIDQSRMSEILNTPDMFDVARPFVIDGLLETSPNLESGLEKGDMIVSLAGEETRWLQDATSVLRANKGSQVEALVVRGRDTLAMDLQIDSTGMLGVALAPVNVQRKDYNFIQAIPAGFKLTFTTIGGYLKDLKMVATPSTGAYKSVGSFISIGQVFPSAWNWYAFWNILALLSIMLGVMNLLPIPALDGGHIVFTIYEMITGKKPSDNFLMGAQIIGLIILFGIMILAFGNDISRLLH